MGKFLEGENTASVIAFFERQGYYIPTNPQNGTGGMDLVRQLERSSYPRFHCKLPGNLEKGFNLAELRIHLDLAPHHSPVITDYYEDVQREIANLREALSVDQVLDSFSKQMLDRRFIDFLLFGNFRREDDKALSGHRLIDPLVTVTNQTHKRGHAKYNRRAQDWRRELVGEDFF